MSSSSDPCTSEDTNPFLALSLYPSLVNRLYRRSTRKKLSLIDPGLVGSSPGSEEGADWLDAVDGEDGKNTLKYALIKQSYKKLALLHHPDKNPGKDAAKFHAISSAHDALSAFLKTPVDKPLDPNAFNPNLCITWYNYNVLGIPPSISARPPPLTYTSMVRVLGVSDNGVGVVNRIVISLLAVVVMAIMGKIRGGRRRTEKESDHVLEAIRERRLNRAEAQAQAQDQAQAEKVDDVPTIGDAGGVDDGAAVVLEEVEPAHEPRQEPQHALVCVPLQPDELSYPALYPQLLTSRRVLQNMSTMSLTSDAVALLPTVLKNITKYPNTPKYYKVNISKNAFGKYVYKNSSVRGLLAKLGFVPGEGGQCIELPFPASARLLRLLTTVMWELKNYDSGGGKRLPSATEESDMAPLAREFMEQKVDASVKTKLVTLVQNECDVVVEVLRAVKGRGGGLFANCCLRLEGGGRLGFTKLGLARMELGFLTVVKITRCVGLEFLEEEELTGMENLKMLSINFCGLTEVPRLPKGVSLVDLGDNQIRRVGRGLDECAGSHTLKSLGLGGNLLGAEGLEELGGVMERGGGALKSMDLGGNLLEEGAVREFAKRWGVEVKLEIVNKNNSNNNKNNEVDV
jgi:hypothetical protein